MEFIELPVENVYDQTARVAEQAANEMRRHQVQRKTQSVSGKIKHMMENIAVTSHWAFVFTVVLVFVLVSLIVLRPGFVMSESPDGTYSFSIAKAVLVSFLFAGTAALLFRHT